MTFGKEYKEFIIIGVNLNTARNDSEEYIYNKKKVYKKKETRYWIFTIKTTIYRTFIPSLEHLSIYMKKGAMLERC